MNTDGTHWFWYEINATFNNPAFWYQKILSMSGWIVFVSSYPALNVGAEVIVINSTNFAVL